MFDLQLLSQYVSASNCPSRSTSGVKVKGKVKGGR